jgi:RNA polymerase sigma-70 factor (ECF subfamily)
MGGEVPMTKTRIRTKKERAHFDAEAMVHLDALYGGALRLTRSGPEAEDLVQDTVLRAWERWHQYQPGTNARAWLLRIQTHTFINGCRRRKREREILTAEKEGRHGSRFHSREATNRWADPERGFLERHLSPPVERALEALRPEFRAVVVLSDLQGLSYREIAETIDCPIGTVMSRLFRARKALRAALADHASAFGLGTKALAAGI